MGTQRAPSTTDMPNLVDSANIYIMSTNIAPTAFDDTPGYLAIDLANGHMSAADALTQTRNAIAAHEKEVQAFFHFDLEALADIGDDSENLPLAGVPVALKDNIDTADMPTGYGSEIYSGFQPARDAACAAMLRLAGARLVGKTVSTEFAHRAPGATRNPWNLGHTPGGSSSGSAAAVAAGMVPIALGTQTTGSVIRPASYCGVLGYKPTYGDVNVSGVLANSPSFDTVGIMARCVEDLVLTRRALLDDTVARAEPIDVSQLRVAVCRTPFWSRASESIQQLVMDGAAALRAAGATVLEFDDAGAFAGIEDASLVVSGYEFARTLATERHFAYSQLSPILRDGRMADGLRVKHAEYVAAQRRLADSRAALDSAFDGIDAVLTPAAPGGALEGISSTGGADLNMLWTSLHTPAITLPMTRDPQGLPLGLQLASMRNTDDKLLAVADTVFALLQPKLWR